MGNPEVIHLAEKRNPYKCRFAINPQYLCGHSQFCRLRDCCSKSHLPTICQLSGRASINVIATFRALSLSTPSLKGNEIGLGQETHLHQQTSTDSEARYNPTTSKQVGIGGPGWT
jgi:hypothetical protein